MNASQYEGVMGALEKILDRMPVREIPLVVEPIQYNVSGTHRHRASCHGSAGELICRNEDPAPIGTPNRDRAAQVAADKRQALAIVRAVLDDWIRGAKENHEALGHRRENRGEECWRTFAPSDFRNMINDAARELGVDEFSLPDAPEEDS